MMASPVVWHVALLRRYAFGIIRPGREPGKLTMLVRHFTLCPRRDYAPAFRKPKHRKLTTLHVRYKVPKQHNL